MAQEKTGWYLHIAGEVFGPVDTKAVTLMLQQNRVQFVDFIWTENFSGWERICDIDIFMELMPLAPKTPVPSVPKVSRTGPKIRMKDVAGEAAARAPRAQAKVVAPEDAALPKPAPKRAAAKVRRHTQVEYREKIEVQGYGFFPAINLREGGLMLRAKTPLPVGLEVKLLVPLPGLEKPMEMTGLVIRHAGDKEDFGFAVEFTRVNPAHKKVILQFLERPESDS